MAILSNINDKFAVETTGAIKFNSLPGTNNQILKSNGNASPTWVTITNAAAASNIIGGPYLELAGGTLAGASGTAANISFTVGGVLTGTTATFSGGIGVNGAPVPPSGTGARIYNNAASSYADFNGGSISSRNVSDDSYGYFYLNAENLQFQTNPGTVSMSVGSSSKTADLFVFGEVGIGTSSPAQKLHIKSTTSGPTGIIIENTNNAQSLDLDFWNNAGAVQGRIRYNEGAGSFSLSPNTSASSAMEIIYNGNVGIGTDNPTSRLHVNSTEVVLGTVITDYRDLGLQLSTTQETANSGTGISFDHGALGAAIASARVTNSTWGTDLRFYTHPDATTNQRNVTERMRIDSSGRTIINSGTFTVPAYDPSQGYPLHVQGIASQCLISIGKSGQTTGSQGMIIGLDGTTGYLWMRDALNITLGHDGGGSKLVIQPSGTTSIGATSSYSRLEVSGVIANTAANNDPVFTSGISGTGISTISGGTLSLMQGYVGSYGSGDTITFKYEATSWKSWQLEWSFSAAYGYAKGSCGGYNNNSTSAYYNTETNQGSNINISVAATNVGQHVIVTFSGALGIHLCMKLIYTQSGGDGAPRSDRASLTYNN